MQNKVADQAEKSKILQNKGEQQVIELREENKQKKKFVSKLQTEKNKLKEEINAMRKFQKEMQTLLSQGSECIVTASKEMYESKLKIYEQTKMTEANVKKVLEQNFKLLGNLQRCAISQLSAAIELRDSSEGFAEEEFNLVESRIEESMRPFWDETVVNWEYQVGQHHGEKVLSSAEMMGLVRHIISSWERSLKGDNELFTVD